MEDVFCQMHPVGDSRFIASELCSHVVYWRAKKKTPLASFRSSLDLERETGFEPATSTLARLRSTN